jgi:hypothetical protein
VSLKNYRENPDTFTIAYEHKKATRRIDETAERLLRHDREVLTNYVGELIQHDTSIHLWAPLANKKWYLITSLDDHSRRILYGDLWERETSWAHITAAQYVVTQFGKPFSYYLDNHAIFRFVERRDSRHYSMTATEETAVVQWKEVLKQLGIIVTYALSPAAKGKIERPFRWLQDHLVRTCLHERVTCIEDAKKILYEEIHNYNHKRADSVTQKIPVVRFERALAEKRSLFQPFTIMTSYQTLEDIFCYRLTRVVNPYRKISLNNLQFAVSGAPIHSTVELRISFNPKT